MREFSYEYIPARSDQGIADGNYRISDKDGNRIATCYLKENAETVVAGLNAIAELAAANARIQLLADSETLMRRNAYEWKDAYIVDREMSDKLEKALKKAAIHVRPTCDDLYVELSTTLAEVAAIRTSKSHTQSKE